MKKRTIEITSILFFAILAYFFKYWLIELAPQPVVFDQTEYLSFAKLMIEKGLYTPTSRTYGYPLFLIPHILLSQDPVRSTINTQVVLDVASGILLYILAYKLFRSKIAAWVAMLIQFFNPFTSAYAGVILTETVAVFLNVVILFLFYAASVTKRTMKNISLVLLGIVIGYAFETRPAIYLWGIASLAIIAYLIPKKRVAAAILVGCGILLSSLYQISANLTLHGQFSFITVDSFFARELYDGILVKNAPLFPNTPEAYPPEMRTMYQEYSVLPKNAIERKAMADKYFNKAVNLIKADPGDYVLARFKKMWSMWQKENIFFYWEPDFEKHRLFTYTANLVVLSLSAFGLLKNIVKGGSFHIFTLSILLFMTIAISVSHAEPRLTIPAYPILFLYAGYSINALIHNIRTVSDHLTES